MKKLKLALYIGLPLYGFIITGVLLPLFTNQGYGVMTLYFLNFGVNAVGGIVIFFAYDAKLIPYSYKPIFHYTVFIGSNILFWWPIAYCINKLIIYKNKQL